MQFIIATAAGLRYLVIAGTISLKYLSRTRIGMFVVLVATLVVCAKSHAGGGPENVFLLVNSESQDSLTIANHYIALRKIPPTNVLYIPLKGSTASISSEVFRKQILLPAQAEIESRGLADQIDYLVYSCDFPWRISMKADFPKEKFPPQLLPFGSLTGLTFLNAFVKEKRKEVVSLNTNWYFTEARHGLTIPRAFRSKYRWAPGGKRTGSQGLSYIISSQLGVTDGRSSTVPEIIRSLQLAQQADGTKPKGTIYFMKHKGPRSVPRHDLFSAAATELRRLGVSAKVLDGKFPTNKPGVAGLTCGTAYQNIGQSGCRFLPGAFCDNLTSSGAIFAVPKNLVDLKTGKRKKFQVKISDFIRHGATGACGTVVEPYNIRQKFPLPSIHVHYVSGCSLGESFYQSVSCPYQQLLVGDPLCQPWADIPVVKAEEIAQGKTLRGLVKIKPQVEEKNEAPIRDYKLYVNGQLNQSCKPGKTLTVDTTTLADGYHSFSIVACDGTPIETQGRLIVELMVKNGRNAIALSTKQKEISITDKYLAIDVISTTEAPVEIYSNSQQLGKVPSGTGTLRIATEKLGAGPVQLVAKSIGLRSSPLRLEIAP